MAIVRASLTLTHKGKEFVDNLQKKIRSQDSDSPAAAMKKFARNIKDEVLRQYDSTASVKNKKRDGRLRAAIKEKGPFIEHNGSIRVDIAQNLPPYWKFVEFGIKASHREQTYQVLGWGKAGRLPAGIGRSFRNDSEIVSSKVYQASKGGMRLIPRTKKDLARLKRKLTLEFSHPGFRGHYFIRAGVIYAIKNAEKFLGPELQKTINAASLKAVQRAK